MNQTEADRQRSKDNRDHWMAEAFPLKKPKPEKVNLCPGPPSEGSARRGPLGHGGRATRPGHELTRDD